MLLQQGCSQCSNAAACPVDYDICGQYMISRGQLHCTWIKILKCHAFHFHLKLRLSISLTRMQSHKKRKQMATRRTRMSQLFWTGETTQVNLAPSCACYKAQPKWGASLHVMKLHNLWLHKTEYPVSPQGFYSTPKLWNPEFRGESQISGPRASTHTYTILILWTTVEACFLPVMCGRCDALHNCSM